MLKRNLWKNYAIKVILLIFLSVAEKNWKFFLS